MGRIHDTVKSRRLGLLPMACIGALLCSCPTLMLPPTAVSTPSFTPPAGSYPSGQAIVISCETDGAAIHYTLDGSKPTSESPTFEAGDSVVLTSGTLIIKAIAQKEGMRSSAMATAAFSVALPPAAAPTFEPAAGTYAADRDVTLSTATSGATIYYTTNGDTPTTGSTQYGGPIAVHGDGTSMTIRAIAAKAGMANSPVASAAYAISYPGSSQIIADHSVVARFSSIPASYLTAVKKMWVEVSGESHSGGYRIGLQLLMDQYPTQFPVSIRDNQSPEPYTDQHLRDSRVWTRGEGEWYTNAQAIANVKSATLDAYGTGSNALSAFGFGWCWDMQWDNSGSGRIGGTRDPVYNVRWGGSSVGGPNGDKIWGLDSGDQSLTGNSVCMDTYLSATQQYIDYCSSHGYATKVFFTTGPVDAGLGSSIMGENGYQRELKHNYIRNYVKANASRILFDYADILAYDDAGNQNLQTWTYNGQDYQYQMIADDNMLDLGGGYSEDGDHIGQRGALRLGKAMWWMLARMAGWNGN